MKKRKFICFIGIDGSGKTTLAKDLINDLRRKGISIEYKWGKYESSVLNFFIFIKNKVFMREKDWRKNYEKSLEMKRNLFNNEIISIFYEFFYFLSCINQILKLSMSLSIGKNIVCDRYVLYDTIVDLACDLNYTNSKIENRLKKLLTIAPKPDIVFFVNISEEIAFKRKSDIPSIEYLKNRNRIYKEILKLLNKYDQRLIILDGTKPLVEVKKDIKRYEIQ